MYACMCCVCICTCVGVHMCINMCYIIMCILWTFAEIGINESVVSKRESEVHPTCQSYKVGNRPPGASGPSAFLVLKRKGSTPILSSEKVGNSNPMGSTT